MLSYPKYPLLYEDMPREVFERRLRESEANDHLIQVEMPNETEESPYQYAVGDTVYLDAAVIRTLQNIEAEHRLATPEEQEILSHYVGWGGCADAFDETKEKWRAEYAELKGLLTEEEYESARSSTLNAHYTSPTVIKAIYKCIEDMGFIHIPDHDE